MCKNVLCIIGGVYETLEAVKVALHHATHLRNLLACKGKSLGSEDGALLCQHKWLHSHK